MEHIQYAACYKALGDETRLRIINLLKDGSKCACKLLEQFNITQPTLSYHMKALVDCGLVLAVVGGMIIEITGVGNEIQDFIRQIDTTDIEEITMTKRERLIYAKDQMLATLKKYGFIF